MDSINIKELNDRISEESKFVDMLTLEMGKVIVGQKGLVESLLIALLSDGHILLEGRYYYGLGNIYGNTKRDYFAISNYSTIYIKMSYLFDIARTKNPKIK